MRVTEFFKKQIAIGLAALCATSMPSAVTADDCCWDYDCNSVCDWEWYVGADYLYWKPCQNNLDYAAVSTTSDFDYTLKHVCPEWESGYRIYLGAYQPNGLGIKGVYTHLKASADSEVSVTNLNIQPTHMYPLFNDIVNLDGEFIFAYDAASAYWDSDYKDWFIGATYQWEMDNCNSLSAYIGVAGLNYEEHFNSLFRIYNISEEEQEGSSLFADYSLDFKGAGLRLGTFYHSTICDCFGAYFNVNGSILVGDACSEAYFGAILENGEVDDPEFRFDDDGCCAFVPGYQLGLGLTYDTCICNVDVIFKIGYEFVAWHNLPSYRFFVEGLSPLFDEDAEENVLLGIGTSNVTSSRTVAYHGLTAGVALKF